MANSKDVSLADIAGEENDPIKLMMVEDDDYYQKIVQYLLQGYPNSSFTVSQSGCLADALTYLAKETPDLILLDLNLPDSKGLDTLANVQSISQRIPIIILTGSDERELGTESILRGATDFLVKQKTDADSLVRCIRYSLLKKSEESRMRLLAIEDFMATLAHDLQVPLIGENNVLDALIGGRLGKLEPLQVEALTQLRDSTHNQLSLVQKLIEIYRYESGTPALHFAPLDVAGLIASSVQLTNIICQEKRIKIETNIPPELRRVLGDRAAVIQLLSGLIDNAIKYSDDEGTVIINALNDDGYVAIEIKNRGQTISADQKLRMFQRFWTGVPGKKYVANTGLGLYLCHHIVMLHKGKLGCKSDSIDGTVFSITLPAETQSH